MKLCSSCGTVKPLTQFYRQADRDGHYSHCKDCIQYRRAKAEQAKAALVGPAPAPAARSGLRVCGCGRVNSVSTRPVCAHCWEQETSGARSQVLAGNLAAADSMLTNARFRRNLSTR